MEEFAVQAILSGDGEEQVHGAIELSKLARKQRDKLADRGVIPPLVSMLCSQSYEAVEAALFALLALAFGSERNKIQIVKCGAIPALLNHLQSQSESLIELSITSLLILSSCNANKLVIASSGTIGTLIGLITGTDDATKPPLVTISPQAKVDAVSTFLNLSTSRRAIPLIVASGVVPSLLELISSGADATAVEKAMATLENVVPSSNSAISEISRCDGAIRALVEAVEADCRSGECKEHAVGVLLAVCRSCREVYREVILREGVVPGLIEVSVEGTWRGREMARQLLLLLRQDGDEEEEEDDDDGNDDTSSEYGAREGSLKKQELLEQIMEEIDAGEEATLRLVEEMLRSFGATGDGGGGLQLDKAGLEMINWN